MHRFGRGARRLLLAALAGTCLPAAAQNVLLGTAADYGVMAGTTVTNTGPTVVSGSVGVWPGTAIVGFPPGSIAPGTGTLHSADAATLQAQSDLTVAYLDAAGRVCNTPIAGGLLGGLTLAPGVYCMDAGAITGTLTLNGPGVYIFQMASSLTMAPGASVVLLGGASACGVWWQVTSSATIDTTASLNGNLLALTSITLNNGASVSGRTLARNGQVALNNNVVTACPVGPIPPISGAPVFSVPTLSPLALLMLGVVLTLAGMLALRVRVD
jgi:hypothetical protein